MVRQNWRTSALAQSIAFDVWISTPSAKSKLAEAVEGRRCCSNRETPRQLRCDGKSEIESSGPLTVVERKQSSRAIHARVRQMQNIQGTSAVFGGDRTGNPIRFLDQPITLQRNRSVDADGEVAA